jgi:hypothetical protein
VTPRIDPRTRDCGGCGVHVRLMSDDETAEHDRIVRLEAARSECEDAAYASLPRRPLTVAIRAALRLSPRDPRVVSIASRIAQAGRRRELRAEAPTLRSEISALRIATMPRIVVIDHSAGPEDPSRSHVAATGLSLAIDVGVASSYTAAALALRSVLSLSVAS